VQSDIYLSTAFTASLIKKKSPFKLFFFKDLGLKTREIHDLLQHNIIKQSQLSVEFSAFFTKCMLSLLDKKAK